MSHGGGVGSNGSTLRPKGTVAKSVGGKSSGSVSWLNDLSSLTHLVEQGGSRRGAQMIMLADWHPDIIEFIVCKMQNPKILKWLKENSQDQAIREEATKKLRFEPILPAEKQLIRSYYWKRKHRSSYYCWNCPQKTLRWRWMKSKSSWIFNRRQHFCYH